MKADAFSRMHPLVLFLYFAFVPVLTVMFRDPVMTAVSFAGAVAYYLICAGAEAFVKALRFMVPLTVAAVIINPLISHEGVTILMWLPSGNPLTYQSIWYGAEAAFMTDTVLIWFSCVSRVMTAEKYEALFAKRMPVLSLLLSMTVRSVPLYKKRFKAAYEASSGSGKTSRALRSFRCVMSRSIDDSMDTALSMRARGYGTSLKKTYNTASFTLRDAIVLAAVTGLSAFSVYAYVLHAVYFQFYPYIYRAPAGALKYITYVLYFILCIIPAAADIREVCRWHALKQKN
jgi:energy-coupling factor transport system permease protein